MKSPTTILKSIQMMKSNLKNDKQQLRIIKNNFSSLQRSVSMSHVDNIHKSFHKDQTFISNTQQVLKQVLIQENILIGNDCLNKKNHNKNLNNHNKNLNFQNRKDQSLYQQSVCLMNIKKKHQKQLKQMKQQFKEQIQNRLKQQSIQNEFKLSQLRQKQQELSKYILILQGQLNSASKQIQQLKQTNYQQTLNLKIQNNQLKQKIKTFEDKINKIQTKKTSKHQIQQQFQSQKKNQQKQHQPLKYKDIDKSYFTSYQSIYDQEQNSLSQKNVYVKQQQKKNQYKANQNLPEYCQKYFKQKQQNICQQKINQFFQIVLQSQRSKHSECCINVRTKYQKIVNKLLEQNSILLSKIQKVSHDNLQKQNQNQIRVSNIIPSSKLQKNKAIVSCSNYNSQVTQRNQTYQSRRRKSIVYKISNVLASSNVSIQNSKVCCKKNKDNKKYLKTEANQNFQNDENINLSNIRRTSQSKCNNISPVEDFYSRIEIEETVNFGKKQVNQFNEEDQKKWDKLNISDYQILDDQSKIQTIKGFVNLNKQNQMNQIKITPSISQGIGQKQTDSNCNLSLMKSTNRKKYINVKV